MRVRSGREVIERKKRILSKRGYREERERGKR
jgi:hypothetical protein